MSKRPFPLIDSLSSVVNMWQNCAIVKSKWPKCHFAVKAINLPPRILSKFISYML